jgi:hypothetical protein
MKCAAALNGAGSLFRSIKLIIRCTGRNVSRKRPAKAMTNFFEIEANRTLLIGFEIFSVSDGHPKKQI